MSRSHQNQIDTHRETLLMELDKLTDKLLIFLGIVWLILIILELSNNLSPLLTNITVGIWVIFIFYFVLQFIIAPNKKKYVLAHWITLISLLLPFFRIFRILQTIRVLKYLRIFRSLDLVHILTALNRGVRSINSILSHRGIGYITALTIIVTLIGAAGINTFENPHLSQNQNNKILHTSNNSISNFGDALWWSAMMMTTMGSDYWPKTGEGRIVAWLLALYAFAVFGYITATIASFFIKSDTTHNN
jgi:voltage-gated potassium channel